MQDLMLCILPLVHQSAQEAPAGHNRAALLQGWLDQGLHLCESIRQEQGRPCCPVFPREKQLVQKRTRGEIPIGFIDPERVFALVAKMLHQQIELGVLPSSIDPFDDDVHSNLRFVDG
jgi:hypothetical protein